MSRGFSPLSLTLKTPLDPDTSDVLLSIGAGATALGIPYFLAGATARDIWPRVFRSM